MRFIVCFLLLIPIIAASTKYYSIKAQVYCGTIPYTGEAKMWIQRVVEKWQYSVLSGEMLHFIEEPFVLKTLPIIDGLLNVTVKDEDKPSIRVYYVTIDDHTCCRQGAAYQSLPYWAETFNHHDVEELAKLHPLDLEGIELIKYCPGAQYEYMPQK